jgi:hypothetical protein
MENITLNTLLAWIIFLAMAYWANGYRNGANFQRLHGCQPPKYSGYDRLLGLDALYKIYKASKENRLLEYTLERSSLFGGTHAYRELNRSVFVTSHPANFKAVLMSQFNDFEIGSDRTKYLSPVVGVHSLFTTDGASWKSARSRIRSGLSDVYDLRTAEVCLLCNCRSL